MRLHSAGVRVKSIPGVQTDNAFVNKLLGQLVTMAGVGSKYWAIALEIPDAPNGWASFTFVIDSAASLAPSLPPRPPPLSACRPHS